MNAIEIRNLCKNFGPKQAVAGLYMTVPVGSIYGFIGENGSGKSTTEKMICGLIHPTSGSIKLYDKESLLAGKIHAILCRGWKKRTKGAAAKETEYNHREIGNTICGHGGRTTNSRIDPIYQMRKRWGYRGLGKTITIGSRYN